MNSFSFVFLVTIALFAELSEARCRKHVLTFQNSLASSHDTLQVHCKSGNDDIGVHFVKFNDPVYNIRFGDNIFIGTYWDCLIQHGPKMDYFLNYRAYTLGPVPRCGQWHTWIAKDVTFRKMVSQRKRNLIGLNIIVSKLIVNFVNEFSHISTWNEFPPPHVISMFMSFPVLNPVIFIA